MVNKITGKRLKNVIVYDGLKIILLSVIICIIAVLVFNAITKKPSDGQDFKLIVDDELITGDDTNPFFAELFSNGVENGGYSYETLKGELMYLKGNDESPKSYMLNNVYADIAQDDVCVLAEDTYLGYVSRNNAIDLLQYVDGALNYLTSEGLCDLNGVFNVDKVNAYFDRTRGKDSRFKTEEQIKKGKEDELKRLKAIYNNATKLKNCFQAHPELLDQRTFTYGGVEITGKFALVLDKFDGNNDRRIENLFKRAYKDEGGEVKYTTQGIYIAIGNNSIENGDLFYENLAFLYTLINTYSTYLTV